MRLSRGEKVCRVQGAQCSELMNQYNDNKLVYICLINHRTFFYLVIKKSTDGGLLTVNL